MASKLYSFRLDDDVIVDLDLLASRYANGDRSEMLRRLVVRACDYSEVELTGAHRHRLIGPVHPYIRDFAITFALLVLHR